MPTHEWLWVMSTSLTLGSQRSEATEGATQTVHQRDHDKCRAAGRGDVRLFLRLQAAAQVTRCVRPCGPRVSRHRRSVHHSNSFKRHRVLGPNGEYDWWGLGDRIARGLYFSGHIEHRRFPGAETQPDIDFSADDLASR